MPLASNLEELYVSGANTTKDDGTEALPPIRLERLKNLDTYSSGPVLDKLTCPGLRYLDACRVNFSITRAFIERSQPNLFAISIKASETVELPPVLRLIPSIVTLQIDQVDQATVIALTAQRSTDGAFDLCPSLKLAILEPARTWDDGEDLARFIESRWRAPDSCFAQVIVRGQAFIL